jgi:nicotinate-nucleotide adenylyltransferase
MKIGIYGGSFDPVHLGHLKLAREAASELNLSKLVFVPSRRSPFKTTEGAGPARRLNLLKKALRGTGFEVSDCETRRKGPSYTVDTLALFRRRYPSAILYFLAGTDAAASLKKWKDYRRVLKVCRFTVLTRPGGAKVDPALAVDRLALDALPVSSSAIRASLGCGKSVRGLVPRAIEKDLKRIYQTEGHPHRNRRED